MRFNNYIKQHITASTIYFIRYILNMVGYLKKKIINFLGINYININGNIKIERVYESRTMDFIEILIIIYYFSKEMLIKARNLSYKIILSLLIFILWIIPFWGNIAGLDRSKLLLTSKRERIGKNREQEDMEERMEAFWDEAIDPKNYYPQFETAEERQQHLLWLLRNHNENDRRRREELEEWMNNYTLKVWDITFTFKRDWYHDNYRLWSVKRSENDYTISFVSSTAAIHNQKLMKEICKSLDKKHAKRVKEIEPDKVLTIPMLQQAIKEYLSYNPEKMYKRVDPNAVFDTIRNNSIDMDSDQKYNLEEDMKEVMKRAKDIPSVPWDLVWAWVWWE